MASSELMVSISSPSARHRTSLARSSATLSGAIERGAVAARAARARRETRDARADARAMTTLVATTALMAVPDTGRAATRASK